MLQYTQKTLAVTIGMILASGISLPSDALATEPFYQLETRNPVPDDTVTIHTEPTIFEITPSSIARFAIYAACDINRQTHGPVLRLLDSTSIIYHGIYYGDRTRNKTLPIYLARAGKLEVGTPENYVDSFSLNATSENGYIRGVYGQYERFHQEDGNKIRETNLLINAKNINFDISGNSNGEVHAIHLVGGNSAVINGENITINATNQKDNETCALFASSTSHIEVNGNLDITADSVIYARGTRDSSIDSETTKILLNKNREARVRLNGDITFFKAQDKDTNGCDATLSVNLTTPDSYWKGNVKNGWMKSTDNSGINAENLHLFLDNGAVWSVQNIKRTEDKNSKFEAIPLNYLDFGNKGGIVDLNVSDTTIEHLTGNGSINIHTNDGINSANKLIVQHQGTSSSLSVTAEEITSDYIVDPKSFGETMINAVTDDSSNGIADSAHIRSGEIYGDINAVRQSDGSVVTTVSENPKIQAYKAANMLSMLSLRQENENLTKRLGQIRDDPQDIGAWVRITGNEQEHNDSAMKFKSTTVQVGLDKAISPNWTLGGAFLYTDGEVKAHLGSGDHESYGLAVYSTYLTQSGAFVDLIAKTNYIDNDLTYGNLYTDYHTYSGMLSAEFGKKFNVNSFWYLEPKTQISYGWVKGKTFTMSNDVRIDQDDLISLVGRLGVKTGFSLPNNWGNVYARVSYANDFEGSVDGVARHIRARADLDTDLGGDWMEYAIGCNLNLSNNLYTYLDFEMSDGGAVDENYLWNAGVRMTF